MTPTDIQVLLLRAGVSQAMLAEELGATPSAVCHVVQGRRQNPRIRRAICNAVGLSYLGVWGEEDPGIDRLRPGRPAVIRQSVAASGKDAA